MENKDLEIYQDEESGKITTESENGAEISRDKARRRMRHGGNMRTTKGRNENVPRGGCASVRLLAF